MSLSFTSSKCVLLWRFTIFLAKFPANDSPCIPLLPLLLSARPLPAALLLAMAAAAGKGVLAFAPIYSTDWPALARERLGSGGDAQGWWSRWAGVSCGDGSAGSAAALVAGRGAFRSGRSQRRSARGMGRRRVQQVGTGSCVFLCTIHTRARGLI